MDGEPEPGVDFERANAARMYDYFLGGAHHFAVDRAQADLVLARHPDFARVCRANRSYLVRVVRWCLERGIDQFLDLGSGVPTVGNVHETAHARVPPARVAYVDFEPVAVAHAADLVAGLDTVTITRADLTDPDAVLRAPGVAGLLDLTRPVALLAVAVLHFVPGEVAPLLARYRDALAPGSVQAVSHGSEDQDDPRVADELRAIREGYRGSATEVTLRSRPEIRALFTGTTLVDPGLVDVTAWPGPIPTEAPIGTYGAVGVVDRGAA